VVAEQVGGGHHPVMLFGDQGRPLAHPRIDDGLAGLALQVAEHRAHRHPDARHDGPGVGVHQVGQLLPVTAVEGTHLDGWH
jgi:hypothetical protein